MLSILTASLCSLATGYGIFFSCTSPSCGPFDQSPLRDVSCTSDGVTSSCSNQQSCSASLFLSDFTVTVDSENDAVSVFQQVTINGTQFSQNVSSAGETIPQTHFHTRRPKGFSKGTHFIDPSFPAHSHNRRSRKFSKTLPRWSYQPDPLLVRRSGSLSPTLFFQELLKTPDTAQATINGLYDAGKSFTAPGGSISSAFDAFRASYQKPVTTIAKDFKSGEYKAGFGDTVKFVVETGANAVLATEELPFAPIVFLAVHLFTDQTVDKGQKWFQVEDQTGSPMEITPLPPTSRPPPLPPRPLPPMPDPTTTPEQDSDAAPSSLEDYNASILNAPPDSAPNSAAGTDASPAPDSVQEPPSNTNSIPEQDSTEEPSSDTGSTSTGPDSVQDLPSDATQGPSSDTDSTPETDSMQGPPSDIDSTSTEPDSAQDPSPDTDTAPETDHAQETQAETDTASPEPDSAPGPAADTSAASPTPDPVPEPDSDAAPSTPDPAPEPALDTTTTPPTPDPVPESVLEPDNDTAPPAPDDPVNTPPTPDPMPDPAPEPVVAPSMPDPPAAFDPAPPPSFDFGVR